MKERSNVEAQCIALIWRGQQHGLIATDIWSCLLSWAGIISLPLCLASRTYLPGTACRARHLSIDRRSRRTCGAFYHLSARAQFHAWLYSCFHRAGCHCQYAGRVSARQPVSAAAGRGNCPYHYWPAPDWYTQTAFSLLAEAF